MILFDEFDKIFGSIKSADGMADSHTEMLALYTVIVSPTDSS